MARCEQGYLCDVCGEEVAEMTDSDLYLQFVIGAVAPRELLTRRERHIRCNPVQAQFIVDDGFLPVEVEGAFDKRVLDAIYVREQEELLTRGWKRLQELLGQNLPLADYPLPEVRDRNSLR